FAHALCEARFVARRRIAVDDLLAGHFVHERNRVAQRVLYLRWIAGVDRGADRAKRATQAAAVLTVRLAADDALAMGLDCGFVTSHKPSILTHQSRPLRRRS